MACHDACLRSSSLADRGGLCCRCARSRARYPQRRRAWRPASIQIQCLEEAARTRTQRSRAGSAKAQAARVCRGMHWAPVKLRTQSRRRCFHLAVRQAGRAGQRLFWDPARPQTPLQLGAPKHAQVRCLIFAVRDTMLQLLWLVLFKCHSTGPGFLHCTGRPWTLPTWGGSLPRRLARLAPWCQTGAPHLAHFMICQYCA